MYRLLVVTDQQEVKQTIDTIEEWEMMGFRKPRVVEDVKGALERLSSHRVDAIGIRAKDSVVNELKKILQTDYPNLAIIRLSTKKERQIAIVQELKLYLNRINADYSNDDYSKEDMIVIERNHLTHNLLSGSIHSIKELEKQTNMMRLPISINAPCMLIEMNPLEGDEYLAGRWHYGSERLEVALRNFFDKYITDHYFNIAVVSSTKIRMIIAASKKEEQALDQTIVDAVAEATKSIQQYLDLDIVIKSVSIIDGIKALVKTL